MESDSGSSVIMRSDDNDDGDSVILEDDEQKIDIDEDVEESKRTIKIKYEGKKAFGVDTGCLKKNGAVFILQISRQPRIGFSNGFFLLTTEIHT